jgi:hypothetical protein
MIFSSVSGRASGHDAWPSCGSEKMHGECLPPEKPAAG